jgi:hypothetical protein
MSTATCGIRSSRALLRSYRNGSAEEALARKGIYNARRHVMARPREPNGVEPAFSEEDIQREQFGPRGVPGAPDPAKMTPQREKKTPKNVEPGHTA